MSKAILISIKPQFVAEILNRRKTLEIRKTAPKCELPIDVYIYCTKSDKVWLDFDDSGYYLGDRKKKHYIVRDTFLWDCQSGIVVAKFRLKSVAQYINGRNVGKNLKTDYITDGVLDGADMSIAELQGYAYDESFYAWHISDLEIFDEPKPLADFKGGKIFGDKPPQSWKYVEVEE